MIDLDKNKIHIIKNAYSKDLMTFLSEYLFLKRKVVTRLIKDNQIADCAEEWGKINGDPQVNETYSHYADLCAEILLERGVNIIKEKTGIEVTPTYSYLRIYKHGDSLERHKDRYSCEISATLNIYKDKDWPIFADPSGKENQDGTPIELEPGDLMLYKGEEIEHWREIFYGEDHIQVFLHYNKKGSERSEQNKFDTRDFLGLPTYYRK